MLVQALITEAPVDDQERVMLDLAAGNLSREGFVEWVTRTPFRFQNSPFLSNQPYTLLNRIGP